MQIINLYKKKKEKKRKKKRKKEEHLNLHNVHA